MTAVDYDGEEAAAVELTILETDFPEITIGDAHAEEGAGQIVFDVRMDTETNRDVTVRWTTEDATATAGEDYAGASGQLVFKPFETGKEVVIDLLDDELDEPAETFSVILAEPVNATVGDARATGTIGDDDLPLVGIKAVANQVTEGEPARFNVVRVGDLSVPLEVPVRVAERGDYIGDAPASSVSFSVGLDTAVLVVATVDDMLDEEEMARSKPPSRKRDDYEIGGAGASWSRGRQRRGPRNHDRCTRAHWKAPARSPSPSSLAAPSGKSSRSMGHGRRNRRRSAPTTPRAPGSLIFAPARRADTNPDCSWTSCGRRERDLHRVAEATPATPVLGMGRPRAPSRTMTSPVTRAWLSRFGRTVASQVVDAVDNRLFSGSPAGRPSSSEASIREGWESATRSGWMDILRGSAFRYSTAHAKANGRRGERLDRTWGRGATTSFSGTEAEVTLDGQVSSGLVGVDYQRGRFLGGVLLSRSQGDGNFAGASLEGAPNRNGIVESTLTGIHPYLRLDLTDRLGAWGLLGRGAGTMTTTLDGDAVQIGMTSPLRGRGELLSPGGATGFRPRTSSRRVLSRPGLADAVRVAYPRAGEHEADPPGRRGFRQTRGRREGISPLAGDPACARTAVTRDRQGPGGGRWRTLLATRHRPDHRRKCPGTDHAPGPGL